MKPNIIIFIIDGARASNFGCYGFNNYNITPNIDNLKENALIFKNAFCCINATDPSITTIMSGKHPINHGITNHGLRVTKEEIDFFNQNTKETIPEFLQKEGYKTYSLDWIGRWHRRGFDYYHGSSRYTGPNKVRDPKEYKIKKILARSELIGSSLRLLKLKLQKSHQDEFLENGESLINHSIDLLKKHEKNKPFFMFIHFWDIHTPLPHHKEFMHKIKIKDREHFFRNLEKKGIKNNIIKNLRLLYIEEQIARYCSGISYADKHMNRLFEYLKENKMWENTLIFITGDHGLNLFENDIYFDHHSLYESTIHIPLIVFHSKIKGSIKEDLVQHTDIFPTIKRFLDKDYKNLDGQNLLGKIKRDYVIFEEYYTEMRSAIRNTNYKYIMAPRKDKLVCEYCKIIHGGEEELYDITKDKLEENNLINEKEEITKKMKLQLEKELSRLKGDREKTSILGAIKNIKLM